VKHQRLLVNQATSLHPPTGGILIKGDLMTINIIDIPEHGMLKLQLWVCSNTTVSAQTIDMLDATATHLRVTIASVSLLLYLDKYDTTASNSSNTDITYTTWLDLVKERLPKTVYAVRDIETVNLSMMTHPYVYLVTKEGLPDTVIATPVSVDSIPETHPLVALSESDSGILVQATVFNTPSSYYNAGVTYCLKYGYTNIIKHIVRDSKGIYRIPVRQVKLNPPSRTIEALRAKYVMTNYPPRGTRNAVLDDLLPRALCANNLNLDITSHRTFPSTAVAVSQLTADLLGVRKIPTIELCRILGYSVKDIETLLKQVKAKEFLAVFVGAGGTNINTIYWLNELSEMTNIVNLFKNSQIYDDDEVEFHNILRFPLPLSTYAKKTYSSYKTTLITPILQRITRNKVKEHSSTLHPYYISCNIVYPYRPENKFLYGAPTIETRGELSYSMSEVPLISATHGDISCSIDLNPGPKNETQIETYGLIQLSSFFMNQLKMAITLLELLASDQDLTAEKHNVLDYSFDGTIKLRTHRKYVWDIKKDATVMEVDAINALAGGTNE